MIHLMNLNWNFEAFDAAYQIDQLKVSLRESITKDVLEADGVNIQLPDTAWNVVPELQNEHRIGSSKPRNKLNSITMGNWTRWLW